jgi:hypothetical protein
VEDVLDGVHRVLTGSYRNGPEDLAEAADALAPVIGAAEVLIYLVDYGQVQLCPLLRSDAPPREALSVDGTLAGRAYATARAYPTLGNGTSRLWVPLLDGAQRLGVLEVILDKPDADADLDAEGASALSARQVRTAEAVAGVLAQLIATRRWYGDAVEHTRRRLPMQLATEVVWGLLPPLTFATDRVAVSGILEPCYEIGGDVFDYAVNAEATHVALFDAVGHGIAASMLSTLAINAYRNARRTGLDLVDTYRSIDKWIRSEYPDTFLTAILAELDPGRGRYRRICAGHPTELLLREGKLVRSLPGPTALPLGMGNLRDAWPQVTEEDLQPGDRLLLYTDGVIEARNESGEFFGAERLASFLTRALADDMPMAETMRRLVRAILDHQHEQLQDDATAVCLAWFGSGVSAGG